MAGRNEVTIDVVVRERGGKKVIKDVGDEAKKTGTKFSETSKDAKALGKEMLELETKIRNASKEFKRTGEIDLDLAKTLRRNQSQLRSLTKLRKDLLGFGEPDDDGKNSKFIANIVESFSNALSRGGTTFVGAMVGAAAAAAPFVGATLAAAVVGAKGIGGIAGGVAMAARDPRVQDAAKSLAGTFMDEFGRATEPFVGPTIAALNKLEAASIDIAGKLAPEFSGLADHVAPLTDALVGLVENLLPGFKDALKAGEVVLGSIERELPELGKDLSDMFESFAKDPEAAAAAMHDLLTIIGETARGVGELTHFLSSYYEVLIKVGEVTTGWINDMPGWVKAITPLAAVADYFDQADGAMARASETAPHLETNLKDVADSAAEAAEKMKALEQAVEDAFGKQMSFDEAVVRWQKGLRDLKDELTDGKRTLSIYTEEGLNNRDAMLQQIDVAEQLRQKTVEQTGDLGSANAAYQTNIQTLYQMGLKAGFARTELDALFAPYINGPRIAITEFQFPGLLKGLEDARALAALTGSYSSAARVRAGDTSGYGGGRASGGYIAPGMTADVAESGTGVERVKMLRGGGAIVSNMDQWSAAGSASGYGGGAVGGAQTLVIEVRSAGGEWNDFLARSIRVQVADVGGGSVQKTYGRNDR